MTTTDFFSTWVRQCANALAWFSAFVCLTERLVPGFVSAEFGLWMYAFIGAAFVFTAIAPPTAHPRRGWKTLVGWTPVACACLAFVWLVLADAGRFGALIGGATTVLILGVLATIAWPVNTATTERVE